MIFWLRSRNSQTQHAWKGLWSTNVGQVWVVETGVDSSKSFGMWWPETGSFFPRVLSFCKLQKTK